MSKQKPSKDYVDLPGKGGYRSGPGPRSTKKGELQGQPSMSDGFQGEVKCGEMADGHNTYTDAKSMRSYSQDSLGFDHGTDGDDHLGRDRGAERIGHKE